MPLPDDVLTTVAACEARLREAMLRGDVNALDELLADDLLFVGHDGQLLSKAEDLAIHVAGRLRLSQMGPSEEQLRLAGETVVVSVAMALAGVFADQPFSGRFRYTRIWAQREGRWQLLVGHCTRIEAPAEGTTSPAG